MNISMKFLIYMYFVLIAGLEITAKCPERAVHPVCASDKRIYANPCLAKEKDQEIVDWDQCSCPTACTLDLNPVCGSNGEIYSNRCFLLTAACDAKGDLREAPAERCCKCPNCEQNPECKDFCTRKSGNDNKHECASNCEEDGKPICYDGLIYHNQCHLDCVKPSRDEESNKTANQKPCVDNCNRSCYFIYKPVCGGYGNKYQIYSNGCLLGIATCYDKRIQGVDMSYCNTALPRIRAGS